MTEKQKEIINKMEVLMSSMDDKQLENLLLVGEGMVLMSGINNIGNNQEKKEYTIV